MAKFYVRQRRAMWVAVVQEVEAEDEDAAIDAFYDGYNPQFTLIENAVQRVEHGPVTVWPATQYPTIPAVMEAD